MKILYVGGVWHGLFLLDKGEHEVRVPKPAFADLSVPFTELDRPIEIYNAEPIRLRRDRYVRRAIGFDTPEGLQIRAEVMVLSGAELSERYTTWAFAKLLMEAEIPNNPPEMPA